MENDHGFELIREQRVEEINALALIYRHTQTGAELVSIINNDENKVFGITFRTPPTDSTGVPHIMEHSVLCGSRKYPVKEPFVELMKGSLNTFLNAMTFPDKTCYPVASQNLQDFYNLVDVYLDAVFFPRLTPYTLMQEGWHYEMEDLQSPLEIKGVVFNEMKGAYSEPDSILNDQIQYSLFPDSIYRHDSGGNPSAILELTFDQFEAFHQTYYHPSNARIFFYGDDDPEMRLVLLDEYLHLFEAIPVQSQVDLQRPFSASRKIQQGYEISKDQQDAKAYVTVNWLLPEAGNSELTLGLGILEEILIGTSAAQLRKTLIDSGLGEDLAGRGLETSARQLFFSTGLKGVNLDQLDQAEELIIGAVSEIATNGVDPENIAAAINTVEFHLRENNTGPYPRGIILMLRSLESWLYDQDPIQPLEFEKPLAAIKARLQSGDRYFEHLIDTYLVNNPHRTTVILTPDSELGEQRAASERARLDKIRAEMGDTALQQVLEDCQALKERQETPDTPELLSTIPMLDLSDLDREVRKIPIEVVSVPQGKVLFHDLFTNGILYLDLGFDLRSLPQEWIPYIPLFSQALTETGTQNESFVQLLQRIGRTTGGIRPSTLTSAVRGSNKNIARMFLRGKAMVSQTGELLAILYDVLTGAKLEDRERFRQMALEEKAHLESRLAGAGHAIVLSRLRARFNEADWASEQMGGISQLFFVRDLIQRIDNNWESVLEVLQSIRARLINSQNAICNITLDSAAWKQIQPQVTDFLLRLPSQSPQQPEWITANLPSPEGLTIPARVNFVGKAANLFGDRYKLSGSAFVIVNHLAGTWIWDKVRVQGGAYGGYGVFDNQSGVFCFLSYRDPNITGTLEVYDATGDYLRTLDLSEEELTKAIIGTIGDLDAYQLPDAKGYSSMRFHLLGLTDTERQRLRDEVLATTQSDFQAFASVIDQVKENGAIVILGDDDAIQTAGGFQEIKKVL